MYSLGTYPPPDPLLKTSPVCKYVFSATGNQETIWLQILKTNYNDKIPPCGGSIELSGYKGKGHKHLGVCRRIARTTTVCSFQFQLWLGVCRFDCPHKSLCVVFHCQVWLTDDSILVTLEL